MTGNGQGYTGKPDQLGCHGALDRVLIESFLSDELAVKVKVRMEIGLDQFVAEAKLLLQGIQRRLAVKCLRLDISGPNTERLEVAGHLRRSVVARQHDQGVGQADLRIDEAQQLGQGAVQAALVLFGLQT
jgi:hypothetical protein